MSASASSTDWPGRAYMRSRFTLSNVATAISAARRASSASCTRPMAFRRPASKLWMPTERRFTPAPRKSRNFACSKVPGLASSVISASGSTASSVRAAVRRRSIARAEKRLGVPPPRKMAWTRRPHTFGTLASRSATTAST